MNDEHLLAEVDDRGLYPVRAEALAAVVTPGLSPQFASQGKVVAVIETMIAEIEAKLGTYEVTVGMY